MAQPHLKQLLTVLLNKKDLMTKAQETILWDYYQLLSGKKDGTLTTEHSDAWDEFIVAEKSGKRPVDPLVQLRADVNAIYTRMLDESDATNSLIQAMSGIEERLTRIERALAVNNRPSE